MRIKINHKIKHSQVRVIHNGENLGLLSVAEALQLAKENGMDLIEVSNNPPVCKILDYGKFKYEASKNSKRNVIKEKEVKLGVQIGEHDYFTKINHIKEFLNSGNKVKVTITFKGRQLAHPELGFKLAQKIISDLKEFKVKINPKQSGRTIHFNIE